jgi:glycosyltransferase involved in cell wall biosynthesis
MTAGDAEDRRADAPDRLIRALATLGRLTTEPAKAQVVHATDWRALRGIDREELAGKIVLCEADDEPFSMIRVLDFSWLWPLVGTWLARTDRASRQWERMGQSAVPLPRPLDPELSRPTEDAAKERQATRRALGVAEDRYAIGFEIPAISPGAPGDDVERGLEAPLHAATRQDCAALTEILRGLRERGRSVQLVLLSGAASGEGKALQARLAKLGIPVACAVEGKPSGAETRGRRLRALDMAIACRRRGEGPDLLLEAPAAGCPVVSTPLALAAETLPQDWIAATPLDALERILADMDGSRPLRAALDETRDRVLASHGVAQWESALRGVYGALDRVPRAEPAPSAASKRPGRRSVLDVMLGRRAAPPPPSPAPGAPYEIGMWHKFYKPPWGGGNQFLLCLRKGLEGLGITTLENRLTPASAATIINSIYFDLEGFYKARRRLGTPVLHRVDGPFLHVRGVESEREKDDFLFELNAAHASATAIQSEWSLERIFEMGYRPVAPVLIANTVDPDIFHARGRVAFDRSRKIRLISSSWSSNPRKGGPLYKWVEEHLDWDRFEYTFVGNCSETLARIRRLSPLPSEGVAEQLRQHDVYITASQNDPCSNAVIEALACGLPVLYIDDGGHPEIVGDGGLPFRDGPELLAQLDRLVEHYEMIQRLIDVPALVDVAAQYDRLLRQMIEDRQRRETG